MFCSSRPTSPKILYQLTKRGLCSAYKPYNIIGTIPKDGQGVVVGQYAEIERVFSEEDIMAYGRLVGDMNPLHQSWKYRSEPQVVSISPLVQWDKNSNGDDKATSTKVLAHGMLVASLFTCIFGTLIPGSIYLKQTLDFRKPVYAEDLIRGRVMVTNLRQWKRRGIVLTCDTVVMGQEGLEHLTGHADVWIAHGTTKEP
jgi:3-hydroxybutyryl-CoA dehydratase